jgi:glycosyltransferase involved in cell wall biosynthesis
MLELAVWCRRNRIRVLQSCDLYSNILALPAAALAGVPVRIGSRRDILLPQRSAGQHRLQRHAYRFAHRIVTNSRAAAAQVRKEGIATRLISTIPNGVELTAYPPRLAAPRSRVITTIANLRPEKGHDTLIAAAALVARRFSDVRFQIVGEGDMRSALEEQVRTHGVESHVSLLGHREDVAGLLAASELFVLPSRTEAFPNSLVEAMASGVPSIASRVGGIPELIEDDVNGLLTPAGDPVVLAEAIIALLTDEERAARLGAAARDTIVARYSFERMVASFEQLYTDELTLRSPDALTNAGSGRWISRGTSLAHPLPMIPRSPGDKLDRSSVVEPIPVPPRTEKVS